MDTFGSSCGAPSVAGFFAYMNNDDDDDDSDDKSFVDVEKKEKGTADTSQHISRRDAMDDDIPVIVTTSVDEDIIARNHRCLRLFIGIGVICVALVVGVAIWAREIAGKEDKDFDADLGDPKCLLPIEEQSIFALCSCSGSAEDYVLENEEWNFYENSALQILSNKGLIDGPFDRDSCEPGNQALLWVASFTRAGFSTPDALLKFSGTGLIQTYTLAYTHLVLGGNEWFRGSTSFDDSFDVCQWEHVSCSFLARVVELNLADNNLVGKFPEALSYMPYLQELDMARNPGLYGTIGEFHTSVLYRSLKAMRLDSTSISGTIPSSLSMLTMLNQLDLANTRLIGSLPRSIGHIENLNHLMVNNNALTGTIPTDIGMLSLLQILDLSNNRFSGTIPTEFEALATLQLLGIRNNVSINGMIPAALGYLPHLGTTFLSNTSLDITTLPESFCQQTVRARSYDVVVLTCTEGRPTCSCCESLVLCADEFSEGDAAYLD